MAHVCRRRLCFLSAVLPEASLQLLPIKPGMPPGVRCQEHGRTLITAQPLVSYQHCTRIHLLPCGPPSTDQSVCPSVCPSVTAAVCFRRECVSMCGWVWAHQGGWGKFMGSRCPINWSDTHTGTSCFAWHSLGCFGLSLDAAGLHSVGKKICHLSKLHF